MSNLVDVELNRFVDFMNNGTEAPKLTTEHVVQYTHEVGLSIFNKYLPGVEDNEHKDKLRASALGKPAVLQALAVLGYADKGNVSNKLRHIFHTGDWFESFILMAAKGYGFDVIDEQLEVNFDGVLGHIDAVFKTKHGSALVEVKTMSPRYFESFTKKPNDDRGYVTQLAVYSQCTGLPARWLCLNKGTHQVAIVEPDPDALREALARGRRIIPLLRNISSLRDVLTSFKAPPIRDEETFKKAKTGRYFIPETMKWSSYAEAFYHTVQDVNGYKRETTYATGVKTPEEMEEWMTQLSNGSNKPLSTTLTESD